MSVGVNRKQIVYSGLVTENIVIDFTTAANKINHQQHL